VYRFNKQFKQLLSLEEMKRHSGGQISSLFEVLLHRAFTGDLTAKWREAHMKELLQEIEQQAQVLGELGGKSI
jgi:type I restriction enzyme S subunit